VTVSVNAQILLPRWTPPTDTEPGLAAEWTRFIAALETHEAGHKDISAKAGRDIADQVRGGDVVISMGAGTIGNVPAQVVQMLKGTP